jgi:RNA polymerase sigma-70 factor (ECF subfamily)
MPPDVRPADEQELITRSRQGDLGSFNRLVETYQALIYGVAYRMLGSAAAADDVAQETFISAYQHLRSFRGGSLKSWLVRIATNACYDQLRSGKRQRSTSLEGLQESDPAWQPRSPAESPEESILRAELSRFIQAALQVLTPDQRATVLLSDVEGFSYEEIAEATGASLGTVKSRLSRARAALRDYFLQHGELLPSRFRQ